MFPYWFHLLSIAALASGVVCALIVLADVVRHPQKMAIMNIVWPVCALFASVLILPFYRRFGRVRGEGVRDRDGDPPFVAMVGKAALHCGSGCTLGDIIAEWLAFLVPAIAVAFGWHSVFSDRMFAVWIFDFICAFAIGIVFQYFTIAPMRGLGLRDGIVAALKADTLSLISWQVGMYGFMAIAQFAIYGPWVGHHAEVDTPEFWFAMQIAMLTGFATAWPVNALLLKKGLKEAM